MTAASTRAIPGAVLPNEGGWQDLYNIFLEPATASFDRLDVARVRGECSTVKANATYQWYLEVQVHEHRTTARRNHANRRQGRSVDR